MATSLDLSYLDEINTYQNSKPQILKQNNTDPIARRGRLNLNSHSIGDSVIKKKVFENYKLFFCKTFVSSNQDYL